MLTQLAVTSCLALSAAALPQPHVDSAPAVKRSHGIPTSPHSISFSSKVPRRASKQAALERYATKLRDTVSNLTSGNSSTVTLDGPDGAVEYALSVTIGSQIFDLVFDTGSSDLWVYASNFTCLDAKGAVASAASCDFGGSGFNLSSSGFIPLNYTNNFDIEYGDDETATGFAGTDTVTIGNISVTDAEFAIVDDTY
ncbi:hypothetical protein Q5752_004065 [Cryptotrichosporon argae]